MRVAARTTRPILTAMALTVVLALAVGATACSSGDKKAKGPTTTATTRPPLPTAPKTTMPEAARQAYCQEFNQVFLGSVDTLFKALQPSTPDLATVKQLISDINGELDVLTTTAPAELADAMSQFSTTFSQLNDKTQAAQEFGSLESDIQAGLDPPKDAGQLIAGWVNSNCSQDAFPSTSATTAPPTTAPPSTLLPPASTG